MSNIPDDLLYTKDDEWIRVDGDTGVVGITDYAQDALSDLVYIELPEAGNSFEMGEIFGIVESVKAAADLFMPVSGEVVLVNDELVDMPEVINTDPFGNGWMVEIKFSDKSQLDDLMDAAAYSDYCDERS